jgi:hypothetical protein
MRAFTNLAWPDDPYGTGQLHRKAPPLLAGVALQWIDDGERAAPVAAAMAYLKLHRTRPAVFDGTAIAFGFRAVVIERIDDVEALLEVVDLDLLQARRHAAILAGHSLADDLYGLAAATSRRWRGVDAVAQVWHGRDVPRRDVAARIDTAHDGPAADADLRQVCIGVGIAPGTAPRGLALPPIINDRYTHLDQLETVEWFGAAVTERALSIALAAGHAADRCAWPAAADIASSLAVQAWDSFPSLVAQPPTLQPHTGQSPT